MKFIDGSVLEGGGQILRNVSAYSCLFQLPIQIDNIRAGRDKPGLRPQHLCGLQLVGDLCKGKLQGAGIGSTSVTFNPGNSISLAKPLTVDTKTAGSISLLLQTSIPCLAFSSSKGSLELIGGTDAEHAPPINYISTVFKHYAEKFGLQFEIELRQRGYYPRGGGRVVLTWSPVHDLKAVEILNQGNVRRVYGRCWVAGSLPKKIAYACRDTVVPLLKKCSAFAEAEINIDATEEPSNIAPIGSGNGIELYVETDTGCLLSTSVLGRKGYSSEQMGRDAADKLIGNVIHGQCVDEHMQDQLVILMTLAKGHSRIRTGPPTLHTKTAIAMAELMTDSAVKFKHEPDGHENGRYILEATGIGFENKYF